MEGTCTPVAADFMLTLLGRAAAGGKELWGDRDASEDGPLKDEVRTKENDFGSRLLRYNTVTTPNWSMRERSNIKVDEEYLEFVF